MRQALAGSWAPAFAGERHVRFLLIADVREIKGVLPALLLAVGIKADIASMRDRPEDRLMAHKVCPLVIRTSNGVTELLAFRHPTAGKQFVKGTIKEGEAAADAALRELAEESGIINVSGLDDLGQAPIGETVWHFFAIKADGLSDGWAHQTQDDFGHTFAFFWHPLAKDLDDHWHPQYHEALDVIRRLVPQ